MEHDGAELWCGNQRAVRQRLAAQQLRYGHQTGGYVGHPVGGANPHRQAGRQLVIAEVEARQHELDGPAHSGNRRLGDVHPERRGVVHAEQLDTAWSVDDDLEDEVSTVGHTHEAVAVSPTGVGRYESHAKRRRVERASQDR